MGGLDPRLVRRAGAVRALLALDAALGVVAALLVLAQAVLIAAVAARVFGGADLDEVALLLALHVIAHHEEVFCAALRDVSFLRQHERLVKAVQYSFTFD